MADIINEVNKTVPSHHVQQELCLTRPLYRRGKKLTAVKVYTVNNESQHIILYGVPKVNLREELKALCMKYGELKKFSILHDYEVEEFTECYHSHYRRIQSARIAKRFLDNKSFYGGILHVCYAPELETVIETKEKLKQRQKDVLSRLVPGPTQLEFANAQTNSETIQKDRKRKHPAIPITEKRLKCESDSIWEGIPAELDPRIQNCDSKNKLGIKKHFQIPKNVFKKGTEYGPYLTKNDLTSESSSSTSNDDSICTMVIPTPVVKTYKNRCEKRIVFKNKKICQK